MIRFALLTIVALHSSSGLQMINTGLGLPLSSTEELISDFATLAEDPKADLPTSFTICSSVSTMAFTSALSFFQVQTNCLLLCYPASNGSTPWQDGKFEGPQIILEANSC